MLQAAQLPYVLAGMVLMTLQPLLVKLSQNEKGRAEYSTSSAVLLMETLKIAISGCMFIADTQRPAVQVEFLKVFTALLFRIVLGRRLSYYQYLAIWQLACGSAVSQLPRPEAAQLAVGGHASFYGFLLAVFSCVLSAFGGIYNEKLLKDKQKDSIHWQNILLYSWGILFNLATVAVRGDLNSLHGFFHGYNIWTGAVVLNNALNGLAISAILKYADNIARVYASAAAMLLTMVLSVTLFGESLSPQLLLAILVVSASAIQYNIRPEQLGFEDQEYSTVPTEPPQMELAEKVPSGSPHGSKEEDV